jgi:hypothetical protein
MNNIERMQAQTEAHATFRLVDDGTLDTVVQCTYCGGEERFDSLALLDDDEEIDALGDSVDDVRRRRAISSAEADHECEG